MLNFKRRFIAGLITILPLWLSVMIVWLIFTWVSSLTMPIFAPVFHGPLKLESQGLSRFISFVLAVIMIWLVGMLVERVAMNSIVRGFERLFERVPLISDIYRALRKLTQYIFVRTDGFKQVVLVEFPQPGCRTIGFVTGSRAFGDGSPMLSVFVPTTPNPTTGFLFFVDADKVTPLNMPVDEAIKTIISGGIIGPENAKVPE